MLLNKRLLILVLCFLPILPFKAVAGGPIPEKRLYAAAPYGLEFYQDRDPGSPLLGIIPYGAEFRQIEDFPDFEAEYQYLSLAEWQGQAGWVDWRLTREFPVMDLGRFQELELSAELLSAEWFDGDPFAAVANPIYEADPVHNSYRWGPDGSYAADGFEWNSYGEWQLDGDVLSMNVSTGFYDYYDYAISARIRFLQRDDGYLILEMRYLGDGYGSWFYMRPYSP